ncbi:ERF2 [Candida pseudojiufengensis]|uniref:ERF2 n=1 Tax=Candida pseudojiufengensis TaxID=497109 RepID=UPI0022241931|nr:ERF2 [Candida pseudojiufengensis]KAI5960330.1 ERF2 [Candida pseudojiufengensis]
MSFRGHYSTDDPTFKSNSSLNQSILQPHSELSNSNQQTINFQDDENQNTRSKISFLQRFVTNWLIMDPLLLSQYEEGNKNYKVQKDEEVKHIYLFGGRLRITKTKPIIFLTFFMLVIPIVFYCVFEANWQWHNLSPAVVIIFIYLWLITFGNFIKAATSDPGILPRNLHLPKSLNDNKIDNPPEEYFNSITLPFYDDKKFGVNIKYCSTCHIWRPPRTSHCKTCQFCVLNHDHHFIHLCYYRIGSVEFVFSMYDSIQQFPLSLFLIIFAIIAFIYPFMLLVFHIFLTCQNLTTREYLNYIFKRKNVEFVNVFNTKSVFKNLYINWLGKSNGVSTTYPRSRYQKGDVTQEKIEPLQHFSVKYD